MKTHPVAEQDVQEAWLEMPATFRETHQLPPVETREAMRTWADKVRKDCAAVIVITLQAATAALANGDTAGSQIVAAEVRPFQRLKCALDTLEGRR